MKVKDLFLKLATRAGIAEADAKLTALVGQLPDLDVDDEALANPLTANLITEDEAANRPTLKSKFTAQALNGVDSLVDPVLSEFFDAAELESFKTENKSTTKKLAKLIERAKTAKQSGANPTDAAKTIADLNAEIDRIKQESESTVSTLKTQYATERYMDKLASKVISRNDVVDYAKAKEGKRVINDLMDTLDTLGGVINHTSGAVMRKDDPTAILYVDNKPATVDGILEKTLKDNDYLKKSDPAPSTKVKVQGDDSQQVAANPAVSKNLDRVRDSTK